MLDLLFLVLPYVLTFLVGLILKSPYYQRPKQIGTMLFKALEDDKLTAEEIKELYEALKPLIDKK